MSFWILPPALLTVGQSPWGPQSSLFLLKDWLVLWPLMCQSRVGGLLAAPGDDSCSKALSSFEVMSPTKLPADYLVIVSNSSEALCHIPWGNFSTWIPCHYSSWIITPVAQLVGLIIFNVFFPLLPWPHDETCHDPNYTCWTSTVLMLPPIFSVHSLLAWFCQFFKSIILSTFLHTLFPSSSTWGWVVHHYSHTLSISLSFHCTQLDHWATLPLS